MEIDFFISWASNWDAQKNSEALRKIFFLSSYFINTSFPWNHHLGWKWWVICGYMDDRMSLKRFGIKLSFFGDRAFRSLGFLPNLILKSHEKSSSRSTSRFFCSCQWYHRIWRSMGRLGRGLSCSWRLFCLWSNGKTLRHSGQWRWHSYERPLDEILPRVKLNKPGLGQPGCQSISRFVGRLANAWLWILPQDHLHFCF